MGLRLYHSSATLLPNCKVGLPAVLLPAVLLPAVLLSPLALPLPGRHPPCMPACLPVTFLAAAGHGRRLRRDQDGPCRDLHVSFGVSCSIYKTRSDIDIRPHGRACQTSSEGGG